MIVFGIHVGARLHEQRNKFGEVAHFENHRFAIVIAANVHVGPGNDERGNNLRHLVLV
jgi:hypothetical protein